MNKKNAEHTEGAKGEENWFKEPAEHLKFATQQTFGPTLPESERLPNCDRFGHRLTRLNSMRLD